MTVIENLSDQQLDILKEIGNISAGNAATSLSILLNQKIDLFVPVAEMVDFEKVCDFLGGDDQEIFAVYFRVQGEIQGNLFLLLNENSVKNLLKETTDFKHREGYTDFDLSVIKEIGNIISGTYITTLSDMSGVEMFLSPPELQKDMAAAIMSFGILEYSEVSEKATILNTSFVQGEKEIEGFFTFFPSPESVPTLFNRLGVDTK